MTNKPVIKRLAVSALAAAASLMAVGAQAQDTIKIAYIEPLSGPFANVGDAGLKHFRYMADRINASGGVLGKKIEIVPFDNKGSPQESLVVLRQVIDQGINYITQGNGSHVAHALVDAVDKHNSRNRDNRVLYLNYAAVDPELTNNKCSFWHFRFDANAEMKLAAITDYMVQQENIKNVYLINMDYAHGHQVSSITKRMLAEKKPDIKIVGDVFHPIGKVKDFSPYVMQIKASGAETVVTGNWGNDLSLLVKAGSDAGLKVAYHSFYAGGLGTPSAIGAAGEGLVHQITEWHLDLPTEKNLPEMEDFAQVYAQKYDKLGWYYGRIKTQMEMLVEAMKKANSTDPLKVALALESMEYQTPFGPAIMRKDDHQLLQTLFISKFTKDAKHDVENTGLGFVTVAEIPAEKTALPTTCNMKRPQ